VRAVTASRGSGGSAAEVAREVARALRRPAGFFGHTAIRTGLIPIARGEFLMNPSGMFRRPGEISGESGKLLAQHPRALNR
jgi:hypothetical protein